VENKMFLLICKAVWQFLERFKKKRRTTMDPAIPLFLYVLKRNEITSHKILYINVHRRIIPNSQNGDSPNTHQLLSTQNTTFAYNEVLFSHKKE
jgi:hypothetical protein